MSERYPTEYLTRITSRGHRGRSAFVRSSPEAPPDSGLPETASSETGTGWDGKASALEAAREKECTTTATDITPITIAVTTASWTGREQGWLI